MLSYEEITFKLKSSLSVKRYEHSEGVCQTAIKLARLNNIDEDKAKIAGILHDCAKDYPPELAKKLCKEYHINVDYEIKKGPEVIHSFLGAEVAKREYKIEDSEILNAIRYHTTGRANMSPLEIIIYLSDVIEQNRRYEGVEQMREMCYKNINEAIEKAIYRKIEYARQKGKVAHPMSLEAYSYYKNLGGI